MQPQNAYADRLSQKGELGKRLAFNVGGSGLIDPNPQKWVSLLCNTRDYKARQLILHQALHGIVAVIQVTFMLKPSQILFKIKR